MNRGDLALKQTRVWVVALLLMVGTVVGGGIWLTKVGSQTTYGEPFVVEYSDETRFDTEQQDGEWNTIRDFPYVHEKDPADLTYPTFHEYIRVEHTGRGPVNVSIEIGTEGNEDQLRFVLIEDFVDPEEVSWDKNRSVARYNGETHELEINEYYQEFRLEEDEKELTLINVYSGNGNENSETMEVDDDVTIIWNFRRHSIELYNFTPIIIIISIIIASNITYVLFKDVEVFK